MSIRSGYIWLARRRGIGPATAAKLLEAFGSPEEILAADRETLQNACPLRPAQLDALCDDSMTDAETIIKQCLQKNIRIITIGDSEYPDCLRAIANPPVVLYVRGRWPDFDAIPGIAVVGTRKATIYGRNVAGEIGRSLARAGLVTVSGMALGIDGEAHRGALQAGGLTVAVLAGGVDICYPPEHSGLMGDILLAGAVVSEYPPGMEPKATHYHMRNRILSGLCVATVVVEAANLRSGSMITARHALDQNRDIYAVPGPLDAPNSFGCNKLIADSEAALLYSVALLAKEYGSQPPFSDSDPSADAEKEKKAEKARKEKKEKKKNVAAKPEPKTAAPAGALSGTPRQNISPEEQQIVTLVQNGLSTTEDLIEQCGLPASQVMSMITMLEVNGVLGRDCGRLVVRNL